MIVQHLAIAIGTKKAKTIRTPSWGKNYRLLIHGYLDTFPSLKLTPS